MRVNGQTGLVYNLAVLAVVLKLLFHLVHIAEMDGKGLSKQNVLAYPGRVRSARLAKRSGELQDAGRQIGEVFTPDVGCAETSTPLDDRDRVRPLVDESSMYYCSTTTRGIPVPSLCLLPPCCSETCTHRPHTVLQPLPRSRPKSGRENLCHVNTRHP